MACLVSRALVLRPVQADTLRFVYCTHKPFMATIWLSSINTTRGSRGYSSVGREPQQRLAPATLSYGYDKGRAPWAFPFSCGAHTITLKPSHLHCIRLALLRGMPTSWLLCFCSHSPLHCFDKKATQGFAHGGCGVVIAPATIVSVSPDLMLTKKDQSLLSWQLTKTYLNIPLSNGDMKPSMLHFNAPWCRVCNIS